ncbi:glycosyltransferase family 2 protein [Naasia sp. SYSU D00057]|uniref:glycosyltransferase family 2 protein n=1 Tax=Naasia sp. SYSU D00057 TaxID=2817380 RepID=UPI001B300C6A|nr:glycosyltransferase family 2 protein [Naasia sp. SYSU D00057]
MTGTLTLSRGAARTERLDRRQDERHLILVRLVATVTLLLGTLYIAWRWLFSLNPDALWIAVPLVLAETYSLIDVTFFAITVWRVRRRPRPPAPPRDWTVDVFIATYNEPIDLVLRTAEAAKRIHYPHRTWVLDDGNRPELREAIEREGIGYLTRGAAWDGHQRHAKAGNLNNAILATEGEFILVLDADQVPDARILDHTLGYFLDDSVAFVQTPQTFGNVGSRDPLGSDAPLFYGPIQQGKDAWNAAFFCGSNAVLRREALMQLAIARYVKDVERSVAHALRRASRVLEQARRTDDGKDPVLSAALSALDDAIGETRRSLQDGEPIALATFELQRRVEGISRDLVAIQLHAAALDLADLAGETGIAADLDFTAAVDQLSSGESSPLAAFTAVQALIRSLDVDLGSEAQPLMPLATISVTEDMATAMRLHSAGWRSVYHHENLAVGLAPEDLGTMLRQRLRWAQGTVQVMLRENPHLQRSMTFAQRLMYAATGWSYLSGFATVVYFAAPIAYLCFGVLPATADPIQFLVHFLPFLAASRLLFLVGSRGIPTRRGRQYSVALFPVWIRATVTAAANVFFARPLDFVVTPKTRQRTGNALRLVWPQAVMAVLLAVSVPIGVARVTLGVAEPIPVLVNVVWVAVDLAALGVLVSALRYRGYGKEAE